jgi:hypothetical protein
MITAGAYVLKVPERRREILLDMTRESWVNPEDPVVAKRVPRLGHKHACAAYRFCLLCR